MLRSFFLLLVLGIGLIIVELKFNFLSHAFNKFRVVFLKDGGKTCIANLKNYTKNYKILGTFSKGQCGINNAVRVNSYIGTNLSNSLTLSCPTALAVGKYFKEIKAKNITHMGTYNCRTIAGSKVYSEHSYGTAIDISAIDGAVLSKDWNKNTRNGDILKKAYDSSCKYFSNILTPDTNKAHKNHFHFDNGLGFGCYLKWLIK